MASSSKLEKKDQKELDRLAKEAYEKRKASERILIEGQSKHGGFYGMGAGEKVHVNERNEIVMGPDPTDVYKYNDRTGDYRSLGGGSLSVGMVPQAVASSGGGGGGGRKPDKKPGKPKIVYGPGEGPEISTMPADYDSWDEPMYSWQPITPGQTMNPLIDPRNNLWSPNPADNIWDNPGMVVTNPQPMGVLV